MKNVIKISFFLIFFNLVCAQQNEEANKIITFFIEPYSKNKLRLFSTYAGYLTLSDENGQIIFPRKTVKESINLLVTTKIFPVFMFQNTIAYWDVPENIPAKMYQIERKKDNETGLYYWNTTEKNLGTKRKIPLHTIIIFADPENIVVPTGISISTNNPQLILPTIYSKKDQKYIQNSMFILTIRPFFSMINNIIKKRPLGYAKLIS